MTSDRRLEPLVVVGVQADVVRAIADALREAPDEALNRINVLDFAKEHNIDEEATIDGFLHGSKLGLFELSWNVLCPGCAGILSASTTLKQIDRTHYGCALCATEYEFTLDDLLEVSFTVSPRLRKIPAHDPETLSFHAYFRELFYSHVVDLPHGEAWDKVFGEFTLGEQVVEPFGKHQLSFDLPSEFIIVFDPVVHGATFLDVKGEPTTEVQNLSVMFCAAGAVPAKVELRPGPLRLEIENTTDRRLLVGVFIAGDKLHAIMRHRRFLTAKRLLSNQTFRDLFRAETLDVDQRLKIASLTVLFTDLKGSTELYERVGDLAAYDLVKSHFKVLARAVRRHGGAVVKTIGDAVMATFPAADQGVKAAIDMRRGIAELNASSGREDLIVKIGLHEGPCLAVVSNERLDYFGQTVNIAARVQGLADSDAIFATVAVALDASVASLLVERGLTPTSRQAVLKGIRDEVTVYEIP